MTRSSMRRPRTARPGLEGLEGRQLLSGSASAATTTPTSDASSTTGTTSSSTATPTGRTISRLEGIPASDRRISYVTPQGTHVTLTVYGAGSLAGTTVDPNGDLHLVFSGTDYLTGIIARVRGGTGEAPLADVRNATIGLDNFSGVGSSLLNILNLKNFNLINGGQINLTGGVHELNLNSVGSNTQIHLRELPSEFTTTSTSASATTNGVNLQFALDELGAATLTSVSGSPAIVNYSTLSTVPASAATIGVNPGPPPAPPGIVLSIGKINGPPRSSSALEDPEVYGYDPVENALILFDATTGAQVQTIPLTGVVPGSVTTGVALGRDNEQLVALVGNGTTIYAFNALTGTLVGQFTTTNLSGFTAVDGIGSSDSRTVIMDSTAGPGGMAQLIDVTASLASGEAVPVGSAFAPQNEFTFAGGLTGIAGQSTLYATGSAFFNTQTPNLTSAGVMAIGISPTGKLSESSRAAIKNSSGGYINTGSTTTTPVFPFGGLGSIDQDLALLTGVSNGMNTVALYDPSTQTKEGTITLDDPHPLTDLSESFRPDLVDSALIDIQGNLQSLRATSAVGMVLNVDGYSNLVKIQRTTDSTIVALPFAHAQMPYRSNVTILSTARSVGTRNGVIVDSTLQPVGPLSLPTPGPTG